MNNEPTFPLYFPHKAKASSYMLLKSACADSRAVPPKETWISKKYGATDEEYLASGQRDVQEMLDICSHAGVQVDGLGHILEFGCADGRMLRWLRHLASDREVWGTDIDAGRIFWCKQNLGPPFHFITNTTVPYLPFEDRHFGFIYAGSVFTHIDDLADAWFAELRRILRPGGKLFVTVHLKNDIVLLRTVHQQSGLAELLRSHPEYERFIQADFAMFTIGRSSNSFVFYDLDYLRSSLEPMYRVLSVTEGVRLYQNALLLERV